MFWTSQKLAIIADIRNRIADLEVNIRTFIADIRNRIANICNRIPDMAFDSEYGI